MFKPSVTLIVTLCFGILAACNESPKRANSAKNSSADVNANPSPTATAEAQVPSINTNSETSSSSSVNTATGSNSDIGVTSTPMAQPNAPTPDVQKVIAPVVISLVNCNSNRRRDSVITGINSTSTINSINCDIQNSDTTTAIWSADNPYDEFLENGSNGLNHPSVCNNTGWNGTASCGNVTLSKKVSNNIEETNANCPAGEILVAPPVETSFTPGLTIYFCTKLVSNGRVLKYDRAHATIARGVCPSGMVAIGWQSVKEKTPVQYPTNPLLDYAGGGLYNKPPQQTNTPETINVVCVAPKL